MSKFTKCYKALTTLLDIKIDFEPEYEAFLKMYFEIGGLDNPDMRPEFDPRKTTDLLQEFQHLLEPKEFYQTSKNFKAGIRAILKEALSQQDVNQHTPLHIASYFGDFKAARYMVELGAEPTSADFSERPLEVSKDKFARSVLQNLNDAAF
jgi:hypothetical protein